MRTALEFGDAGQFRARGGIEAVKVIPQGAEFAVHVWPGEVATVLDPRQSRGAKRFRPVHRPRPELHHAFRPQRLEAEFEQSGGEGFLFHPRISTGRPEKGHWQLGRRRRAFRNSDHSFRNTPIENPK